MTSRLQYLGNQDAAQKCRPVSQRPGAWAGLVTFTDQNAPRKMLTQKKWDEAKEIVQWVKEYINNGTQPPHQPFLLKTGFMGHATDTYDVAKPYMQGFSCH